MTLGEYKIGSGLSEVTHAVAGPRSEIQQKVWFKRLITIFVYLQTVTVISQGTVYQGENAVKGEKMDWDQTVNPKESKVHHPSSFKSIQNMSKCWMTRKKDIQEEYKTRSEKKIQNHRGVTIMSMLDFGFSLIIWTILFHIVLNLFLYSWSLMLIYPQRLCTHVPVYLFFIC